MFPTQLAKVRDRAGAAVDLARSGLAQTLLVDPSAAGSRFSARVEAAVYFCCAEAARTGSRLSAIELSRVEADLVLRVLRRRATAGSTGRRSGPGGGGRGVATDRDTSHWR